MRGIKRREIIAFLEELGFGRNWITHYNTNEVVLQFGRYKRNKLPKYKKELSELIGMFPENEDEIQWIRIYGNKWPCAVMFLQNFNETPLSEEATLLLKQFAQSSIFEQ